MAWPLILANTTTPLLGIVDTAVLGHRSGAVDLAAIALGSLIISFLYWSFGFLRMTTTGFVAQARGAGDDDEMLAALARPLVVGFFLGTLFVLAQNALSSGALKLFEAGQAEESSAARYFAARIWGAPASLASLGTTGFLIGMGRTKELLWVQLITNGLNIVLDVTFVTWGGWGVQGVGWGTAIAEWVGGVVSFLFVASHIKLRLDSIFWRRVLRKNKIIEAFHANRNVMIRTVALLSGFVFFTNQGAQFGTCTLATNHVLLQFTAFSAFFLDGFANVAESLVGHAKGARDLEAFRIAIRRTSEVAVVSALLLALIVFFFGPSAIDALTNIEEVRSLARSYLPLVALYVAFSVGAFQLDGIFLGVTGTKSMRNASLWSLAFFILCAYLLIPRYQNFGLWYAFDLYICARGITLGALLPQLRRNFAREIAEQGR